MNFFLSQSDENVIPGNRDWVKNCYVLNEIIQSQFGTFSGRAWLINFKSIQNKLINIQIIQIFKL